MTRKTSYGLSMTFMMPNMAQRKPVDAVEPPEMSWLVVIPRKRSSETKEINLSSTV